MVARPGCVFSLFLVHFQLGTVTERRKEWRKEKRWRRRRSWWRWQWAATTRHTILLTSGEFETLLSRWPKKRASLPPPTLWKSYAVFLENSYSDFHFLPFLQQSCDFFVLLLNFRRQYFWFVHFRALHYSFSENEHLMWLRTIDWSLTIMARGIFLIFSWWFWQVELAALLHDIGIP